MLSKNVWFFCTKDELDWDEFVFYTVTIFFAKVVYGRTLVWIYKLGDGIIGNQLPSAKILPTLKNASQVKFFLC